MWALSLLYKGFRNTSTLQRHRLSRQFQGIGGRGVEECGLLGSNLWISRERSTWGKQLIILI